MYVKHIPQHNNLSPTSLLIPLTVFVAGATNQPDIQTQTGSYLRSGRVRTMKPDECFFTVILQVNISCSFPVAQLVEHGVSNAKIMGSIPRESKSW